jgi:NADPH:quinone reductase-like Zn-dependent oxidoreductase
LKPGLSKTSLGAKRHGCQIPPTGPTLQSIVRERARSPASASRTNRPTKAEKLKALGADHVIDYRAEDFSAAAWRISGKKGVDLPNIIGCDGWAPSLRTLRKNGRLATCSPEGSRRLAWLRRCPRSRLKVSLNTCLR